jgi:hypothetical protein
VSDLAEFLLARIAEDEKWARARLTEGPEWMDPAKSYGGLPARVLAECEAKRRIVTQVHHKASSGPRSQYLSEWQKDACEGCGWGGSNDDYWVEHINDCPTLRLLAFPYADHPDYDEAWRP